VVTTPVVAAVSLSILARDFDCGGGVKGKVGGREEQTAGRARRLPCQPAAQPRVSQLHLSQRSTTGGSSACEATQQAAQAGLWRAASAPTGARAAQHYGGCSAPASSISSPGPAYSGSAQKPHVPGSAGGLRRVPSASLADLCTTDGGILTQDGEFEGGPPVPPQRRASARARRRRRTRLCYAEHLCLLQVFEVPRRS